MSMGLVVVGNESVKARGKPLHNPGRALFAPLRRRKTIFDEADQRFLPPVCAKNTGSALIEAADNSANDLPSLYLIVIPHSSCKASLSLCG